MRMLFKQRGCGTHLTIVNLNTNFYPEVSQCMLVAVV